MLSILAISRSILATTPLRWQQLMDNLPADLLAQRPAPAEWSAVECLVHLLDTEQFVFPARVGAFLAGQDFSAFNPETQGNKFLPGDNPQALLERFTRLRGESLDLLASLKPADMPRSARHAELGPVTLEQMLHEWVGHDLDHTIQAERAIMQPFIAGCGPWQVYFTANRIA